MAAINATYRQSVNRNKSLRSWNWMRQDSCLLQSAKLSLAINRMCCSPHRKESHPSDRWWDFRPINGTPVTDWVPERLATWRHLKIIDQRRVKWKGFRCICLYTYRLLWHAGRGSDGALCWFDTRRCHCPSVEPSGFPIPSPGKCPCYPDEWPGRRSKVCERPGIAGRPCTCKWPLSANGRLDGAPMTPEQRRQTFSVICTFAQVPDPCLEHAIESLGASGRRNN